MLFLLDAVDILLIFHLTYICEHGLFHVLVLWASASFCFLVELGVLWCSSYVCCYVVYFIMFNFISSSLWLQDSISTCGQLETFCVKVSVWSDFLYFVNWVNIHCCVPRSRKMLHLFDPFLYLIIWCVVFRWLHLMFCISLFSLVTDYQNVIYILKVLIMVLY
jgi:hypothetical protein